MQIFVNRQVFVASYHSRVELYCNKYVLLCFFYYICPALPQNPLFQKKIPAIIVGYKN